MERTFKKKRKGNNKAAIFFGILSVVLLVLGLLLFKNRRELEDKLSKEKEILAEEFENLQKNYGTLSSDNQMLMQELEESRMQVMYYIDSLRTAKMSVTSMLKFKSELINLKRRTSYLIVMNDSLMKISKKLTTENESLKEQLLHQTNVNDSLVSLHASLKKSVVKAINIKITKATVDGVREKKNGKLYSNKKAKKIDMLRICFTVGKNEYAKSGDRIFYIKVEAPDGTVMGAAKKMKIGGTVQNEIDYSIVASFYYSNDSDVDVCDFINKPDSGKFQPGRYAITIYDSDLSSVGEYSLVLR